MKKILNLKIALAIISTLVLMVSISPAAYAVDVLDNQGDCQNPDLHGSPSVCQTSPSNNVIYGNGSVLDLVITIISVIVGIVAVVSIIISGVRMITANGDPNSISSAKKGIMYALIGLLMALLAKAIVSLVVNHTAL
jgi:hypothetical protein